MPLGCGLLAGWLIVAHRVAPAGGGHAAAVPACPAVRSAKHVHGAAM
jgi:hypothetical protein